MELHRRSPGLRAAGAALVVVALALGACGGGDSGKRDEVAPNSDFGLADDEIAQAANFRLTDFPPGWQRSPGAVDPPDSPEDRRFDECMGRPQASEVRTSIANSDNFATGQLSRANSAAQLVRTEQIARDDFAALRGERAVPCLAERLDAELATQTPQGGQPFTRRSLERFEVDNVADETIGFRMVVDAPSVGPSATVVVDQVFVRKGRVEISTSFIEPERPFPAELRQSLLRKLVERAG
ncbi:MAG: hypothetical protein M3314_05610 [Actinomycetota bacterium]|nr:hypothetical protein [Actinomycetota bacterium]